MSVGADYNCKFNWLTAFYSDPPQHVLIVGSKGRLGQVLVLADVQEPTPLHRDLLLRDQASTVATPQGLPQLHQVLAS